MWQLVGDVWNCSGVLGVGDYVTGVDQGSNLGVLVWSGKLIISTMISMVADAKFVQYSWTLEMYVS